MKIIIFIVSLLFSQLVFGQEFEQIFRCYTPINPMNPSFQQGSEVFINVFYNKETEKTFIISLPAQAPDVRLYTEDENETSRFNMEKSTIYFSWITNKEKSYASMVYMGNQLWGAVLQISTLAKKRDPSLSNKNEVDLYCRETQDLLSVFK